MPTAPDDSVSDKLEYPTQYNNAFHSLPIEDNTGHSPYSQAVGARTRNAARNSLVATAPDKYSPLAASGVSTSDANLLLGLNTSYTGSRAPSNYSQHALGSQRGHERSSYDYSMPPVATGPQPGRSNLTSRAADIPPGTTSHVGDVSIETQDIDMSTLQHHNNFPFTLNGEVLPWLEYLPPDVLSYFGDQQNYSHLMNSDDGTSRPSQ